MIKAAKKYGKVMKWWIDNLEEGVWTRWGSEDKWYLEHKPEWNVAKIYVEADEFAELRKAQADGKIIQYTGNDPAYTNCINWEDKYIIEFDRPLHRYRIKPDKPDFKVGDWVVCKGPKAETWKIQTNSDLELINSFLESGDWTSIDLWEPRKGEWCFFWDDGVTNYTVNKYKDSTKIAHRDLDRCSYDNVAPKEMYRYLR